MSTQELKNVTYTQLQVTANATEEEQRESRYRQYIAGLAASMSLMTSGAWFGWPTPLLPLLLGPDSPVPMTREQASWMVAGIEVGCLISPIPATIIADRFGRKFCMLLCAPFFLISVYLTVYVKTIVSLCVARVLQGFAFCLPYTILPIYLGEIASPEVRGTVTGFFHVFWGLGCLFPYCVGPFLSYDSLTYATFMTTVLFVLCFVFQPESPYYYAMRGNSEKTAKALKRLRGSITDLSLQEELDEIGLEVQKFLEKTSCTDIVATPADRRALLLILIVGIVSFLSGQNAILTYATDTFSRVKNDFISPDSVTIGIGFVALLGSVCSMFTCDRYGRRVLLLMSSIGCLFSLLIASGFLYMQSNTTLDMATFSWVAPVAVMAYNFFVTAGMHPVCVAYTSELFPTRTRGIAACISNINLTFSSFLVMKTYEPLSSGVGDYFTYFCYGMVCLIGTFLFYFLMPETKGKTFLEIREDLIK